MGHMDADLVRAAGLQRTADKARQRLFPGWKGLDHLVVSHGVSTARARRDCDPLPVVRAAAQRRLDGAVPSVRRSPDQRQIGALERPGPAVIGELVSAASVGAVVPCRYPWTCGVHVL